MIKTILISLLAIAGSQAHAAEPVNPYDVQFRSLIKATVKPVEVQSLLNWTVGDSADYTIAGGIINGTMKMFVREATAEGYWVQQDADLGFMGKQKVEILYDKNSGQVLQMIVNDKKQTPPNPGDEEVVETKHDHVTVPKGSYDCIYAKIKDKKTNDITEAWINMELIPISGMIKVITPSQIGAVTLELTDFKKQ
jgi:hypothetical protein